LEEDNRFRGIQSRHGKSERKKVGKVVADHRE